MRYTEGVGHTGQHKNQREEACMLKSKNLVLGIVLLLFSVVTFAEAVPIALAYAPAVTADWQYEQVNPATVRESTTENTTDNLETLAYERFNVTGENTLALNTARPKNSATSETYANIATQARAPNEVGWRNS